MATGDRNELGNIAPANATPAPSASAIFPIATRNPYACAIFSCSGD